MKKRLLFTITLCTLSMLSYAQEGNFKKGSIILSGTTGASYSANSIKFGENDGTKANMNTFILNAGGGYFLDEKIVVGGLLSYISLGISAKELTEMDKISLTGLNLYGRYYFKTPENESKLAYYGQINLGYNVVSIAKSSNKGPLYGAAVGLNYFVTDRLSLDCGLNYSKTTIKIDDSKHNIAGTTLNFTVGVSFLL